MPGFKNKTSAKISPKPPVGRVRYWYDMLLSPFKIFMKMYFPEQCIVVRIDLYSSNK